MGAYGLRGVSVGNQTAYDTAVTATKSLVGIIDGNIDVIPQVNSVDTLGTMYGDADPSLAGISGAGQLVQAASFEHINYLLHTIFGPVAGAQTAAPVTRTYSAPTTSVAKPQVYTIEYGVSDAGYAMEGAFGTKLNIKGAVGGVWTATVDLLGRKIVGGGSGVPHASTADSVEQIKTGATSVYIDAWGGTMGATLVSSTLIDFELNVETNNHTKTFVGDIYPSNYGGNRWTGTLKLTLEVNSTSVGYINTMAAATPALIQKQVELYATGSSSRSAKIQFTGTVTSNIKLFDDRDGNMIVTLTFTRTYHSSFANWLKVITISNLLDSDFWS